MSFIIWTSDAPDSDSIFAEAQIILVIYDKPVRVLLQEMIEELAPQKGQRFSKEHAIAWFGERYPKIKKGTISAHLIRFSTNAPNRLHYSAKSYEDLLFQVDPSHFRLYDPTTDPGPIHPESYVSSIPDTQELMLPVLKALDDGAETPLSEVRERVAAKLGLNAEDLLKTNPGGKAPLFRVRIKHATNQIKRAGLVERVRSAVYRLTEEGAQFLVEDPSPGDIKLLLKNPPVSPPDPPETPEEALDHVVRQLSLELEADVLEQVRQAAPAFLEQVVVDLMIAMGYGDGDDAMGQVTGSSGDGGIDGTIREDALGLDEVYLQAKKYADGNTVGESALRNFAGAIDAVGAMKGVFVTTSSFTKAARDYVARSPKRIVLIDGAELARLMVKHNIGVRLKMRYEVKRIDEGYFDLE